MLESLGYLGALCIGLVLGITGSGGSILAVPILVYLLNYNPVTATAFSLFIVGTTSAIGTIQNFRKNLVLPKTALQFALPSIIGVYITRKFLIHNLPDTFFYIGSFQLLKDTFLMLLFAVVMLLVSISMLSNKPNKETQKESVKSIYRIAFQLFLVGILIGLIGAGGGFLIVPALFKIAKLPLKKAIGTSLLIITLNSSIGFLGDVQNISIDWMFLLTFTAISIFGILIGLYVQNLINEKILKKIFGIFILLISFLILYEELFR